MALAEKGYKTFLSSGRTAFEIYLNNYKIVTAKHKYEKNYWVDTFPKKITHKNKPEKTTVEHKHAYFFFLLIRKLNFDQELYLLLVYILLIQKFKDFSVY